MHQSPYEHESTGRPARSNPHGCTRPRRRGVGVVLAFTLLLCTIVSTAGIASLVNGHLGSESASTGSTSTDSRASNGSSGPNGPSGSTGPTQPTGPPTQVSHGFVADGTALSPWDDVPAITNLDAPLLKAVRLAFTAAAHDGNPLSINSGWRSLALQQMLLDQATVQYGSRQEALKWVSTPEHSHHTRGDAIDVGPLGNVAWLDAYGFRYGLCRIYDNEPWHFELATRPGTPCPARLPSAAAAGA